MKELKQKVLGYYFECTTEDTGPEWSCNCSATLKVLAQNEGKEDYVHEIKKVFDDDHYSLSIDHFMTFETLMNPDTGWYVEATDSVILEAHITADAPHGVKNMPDDVYTKYTMRSEHSLFVELEDGSTRHTSSMQTEDKLWSFTYSLSDKTLSLKMAMHESDLNRPIAECFFWYWNDKNIARKNLPAKSSVRSENTNTEEFVHFLEGHFTQTGTAKSIKCFYLGQIGPSLSIPIAARPVRTSFDELC